MNLKAETKVNVTYNDDTSRQTTVAELIELFSEESKAWKENFFSQLETNGHSYGKFAKYELAGSGFFAKK